MPAGGSNRYLFFLAQQGLRETRVQASPVFTDAFRAEWAPNVSLAAVRFTGTTYEPAIAPHVLRFDASERELTVAVATDAERYRPGGRATVSVTTTDASGQPVAATVFLRAIDEKLYAMDDAVGTTEPLSSLYTSVGAGILQTYATQLHPVPPAKGCYWGEGGATGGGGGDAPPWRDDFRDVLLFARVRTGADGKGTRVVQDLGRPHLLARHGGRGHGRPPGGDRPARLRGGPPVLHRGARRDDVRRRRPADAPGPGLRDRPDREEPHHVRRLGPGARDGAPQADGDRLRLRRGSAPRPAGRRAQGPHHRVDDVGRQDAARTRSCARFGSSARASRTAGRSSPTFATGSPRRRATG